MKSDALQLFVRGFESHERGDKIVRVLQDIGFEIKEKFDGSADSLGGLIETHVTPVDCLHCTDLDDIRNTVRRVSGEQTFIQYEYWDRVLGGEDRQPSQSEGRNSSRLNLKFHDEVEGDRD